MSLYYKAWQSLIASKDGVKKWFPRLVKKKKAKTVYDIGTRVSKRCSVTLGDTMNVLYEAMDVIVEDLKEGYPVYIEKLGTFTLIGTASGNGVDTFEEVNHSQFNGLRIRFLPAATRNPIQGTTRAMFSDISFERIDLKESGTGNENDDDDYEQDPNA